MYRFAELLKAWGVFFFLGSLVATLSFAESSGKRSDLQLSKPDKNYSSKISLRSSIGQLKNTGEGSAGTSVLATGGINLIYHYFVTERLGLGIGYSANFDFDKGKLPMYGFDTNLRYYFYNFGTRVSTEHIGLISERLDKYAFYVGIDLNQRNYFLGSNSSSSSESTGTYFTINGGVGGDYRVTNHIELTSELNYSLFSFAASDTRVRVESILLMFGVGYIW